jgi:hypothetical protein
MHVRGHPNEPREMPMFLRRTLDEVSQVGGTEGQRLVCAFLERWPEYERELDADTMGLLWTGGDGPTGAWDLRLMGAQLAISAIAFLDRAKYLIAHGEDPGMLIGLDAYSIPGIVDLVLPRPGHPWGTTRASSLTNILRGLYQPHFSESELRRKSRLMSVVANLLSSFAACALELVRYVNSKPGHYVAIVLPDNKLVTLYFPLSAAAPTEHETIESDASQFYFDLSGRILHHSTSYALLAELYRSEATADG